MSIKYTIYGPHHRSTLLMSSRDTLPPSGRTLSMSRRRLGSRKTTLAACNPVTKLSWYYKSSWHTSLWYIPYGVCHIPWVCIIQRKAVKYSVYNHLLDILATPLLPLVDQKYLHILEKKQASLPISRQVCNKRKSRLR